MTLRCARCGYEPRRVDKWGDLMGPRWRENELARHARQDHRHVVPRVAPRAPAVPPRVIAQAAFLGREGRWNPTYAAAVQRDRAATARAVARVLAAQRAAKETPM